MDVTTNNKLQFKGGNPGAVQYGNFINYYKFHPPNERVNLLPKNIWDVDQPCIALDIGCNAGNLTLALRDFLSIYASKDASFLAIDIDPVLISRAQEMQVTNITFKCLDIMDETKTDQVIHQYLLQRDIKKFTVLFCFSTTMWIHLNHGDLGLQNFLKYICNIAEMIIIEPQPWKCYKTAVKRMKKDFIFPEFSKLKFRESVECDIEDILLNECNMEKIVESERTVWERKLLIFKHKV